MRKVRHFIDAVPRPPTAVASSGVVCAPAEDRRVLGLSLFPELTRVSLPDY
jgi:hypothetical protein